MADSLIRTGVARLDAILGGGLRRGAIAMIVGAPGMGKTILGQQIAFEHARQGEHVVYLTGYSETHDKMVAHTRELAFFDEALLGERITLGSVPDLIDQGADAAERAVLETARRHHARLVVLDSFRSIRRLLQKVEGDDVGSHFLYRLGAQLALSGASTLVLVEGDPDDTARYAEFTVCDVVIGLRRERKGTRVRRLLEVQKVRGAKPLSGLHPYEIDSQGIHLAPRFEALVGPQQAEWLGGRAAFGIPQVDALIGGGLTEGTVTLVAGSPGTGKTLLGLHFVAEGARRMERSLFVGFMESEAQLHEKGRVFGLRLAELQQSGMLKLLCLPGHDLEADAIAAIVSEQVEAQGVRRLVLDSAAHLKRAVWDDWREPNFYAALVGYLRQRQVTTYLSYEVTKITGPDLEFSDTPLSILAENLILLRSRERPPDRQEHEFLVLQMRFSEFDRGIHEYTITADQGISMTGLGG